MSLAMLGTLCIESFNMKDKEIIKQFWNDAKNDYDTHMQMTHHYAAQESLFQEMKKYFIDPILDLAAGTGFLSGIMIKEGLEVSLNDFSHEMYLSLKENPLFPHVNFEDAEILSSYKENHFNTLLCCNLFFYIQNYSTAIIRWSQILREGGRIILFEEYPFVFSDGKEFSSQKDTLREIIRPLSPEDIRNIFKEQGFVCIDQSSVDIDHQHKLFGFIFERI